MPWTDALYPWLVQSALVSLIVLALGSVAVVLCRQPVRQARIIELTLAGCLVAPCLGMIPGYPQFAIGWPQDSPVDLADPRGMPSSQPADEKTLPHAEPPTLASSSPPSEPIVQSEETPSRGLDVPSCIAGIYLCGLGFGLAWWLVGMASPARIVTTAWPASPRYLELFTEIAGQRGDRVRLLVSRRVSQPFASAWWRPVIVLPEGLCADEQSLRWSLAHEWSHVQRHDFRAWLLAGLARVLFFYQPLVWWLRRQLRLAQDFLADAQAARQTPQAEDYAEFLTARAAAGSLPPALVALGIGFRKSELYRRVVMLVQNRPLESRAPRLWTVSATCAALLSVGTVAAVSIAPQAAAEEQSAAAKSVGKSTQVDPAPPNSTNSFVAKFPSGITVELLGISEHPSNAKSWWRPDGSPLPEPPCDPLNAFMSPSPGYVERAFALQWHNLPSEPVDTQVLFHPPYDDGAGYDGSAGADAKRLGKKVAGLAAMAVGLPDQPTVTVRVRLAAGPWQTVCETANWSGSVSIGMKKSGFAFSPVQEKDGSVTLTVTHDIIGPQSRVIAVGLDGREHRATDWSSSGASNFVQITATFSGLSQKDFKVFRVQTRPYDEVEFQNVSLQPGKKTDVQIGPLKTPGSSKPSDTGARGESGNGLQLKAVDDHSGRHSLIRRPDLAKPPAPEPGYGGKPLSYWRSRLHDENLETRIEAAGALEQIGGPAVRATIPSLVDLLRGKEAKTLVGNVVPDLRPRREVDRNGIIWEDGRPIGVWGVNGDEVRESAR